MVYVVREVVPVRPVVVGECAFGCCGEGSVECVFDENR